MIIMVSCGRNQLSEMYIPSDLKLKTNKKHLSLGKKVVVLKRADWLRGCRKKMTILSNTPKLMMRLLIYPQDALPLKRLQKFKNKVYFLKIFLQPVR